MIVCCRRLYCESKLWLWIGAGDDIRDEKKPKKLEVTAVLQVLWSMITCGKVCRVDRTRVTRKKFRRQDHLASRSSIVLLSCLDLSILSVVSRVIQSLSFLYYLHFALDSPSGKLISSCLMLLCYSRSCDLKKRLESELKGHVRILWDSKHTQTFYIATNHKGERWVRIRQVFITIV